MPLQAGTRLGGYEILAQIGVGGMGEVYQARDTRLKRDVALKVLPDDFAQDTDRLARFQREAELLATLNHPNIAGIYGLEESNGVRALVLELVEGPTLADRIAKGPIPLDEALPIARQIAEALEAAHEKGVIHRDLKPANIKVTPDGSVKVLDFGLAKLAEAPAVSGEVGASQSPTITTPAMMTGVGTILGTAAYMSPEQAKGRAADKRSDVWAFGCVVYEILTGKRAFDGEDVSDTLAAVLRAEPHWKTLPPSIPASIRHLLRRCLQKDRTRRLQSIGDARVQIDEALSEEPDDVSSVRVPRWRRAIPIVAAALVAAGLGIIAGYSVRPLTPPLIVTRFTYRLPDGQVFTNAGRHFLTISPDGTTIAYVANRRLYEKAMRDTEATPIPGADAPNGATNPTFAPDGQWIAFFSGGAVKKIPTIGGAAVTLCPAENPFGMSWDKDTIFFAAGSKGIMRVSANGGSPETVVSVKNGEFASSPQMLPDGRSILFTVLNTTQEGVAWENAQIAAQTLGSTERRTIRTGGSDARYVPTGHLVYALGGLVFAVPFNARRLEVTGGPIPVVDRVASSRSLVVGNVGAGAAAEFAFSTTGSLAYVPGPASGSSAAQLDVGFLDRSGAVQRLKLPPGPYYAPRVSPDGRQLAVGIDDGKEANVWVFELSGKSAIRRLTFGGRNRFPIWTSDSQRIAFQSDREGDLGIFWQRADGTGTAERLTKAERGQSHSPDAWSLKGDAFLFDVRDDAGFSLWTFSVQEKKAAPFDAVRSRGMETNAAFSPDGRWVTYGSADAAGEKSGIYVHQFPTGSRFLVATGTPATNPFWSPDGKELFWSAQAGAQFSVVNVRTEPTFSFGNPSTLPRPGVVGTTPGLARNYDIASDGKHFVVVVGSNDTDAPAGVTTRVEVVLNWFTELQRRVPTK